jgi:hypothetical protein
MAIDEESKHRLYGRLEEVLGHHEATTFMEMVRPQGWTDVATKADLEQLELRLEARLEARIVREINQALTTQTRTLIVSNASMLAGVAALAAILGR